LIFASFLRRRWVRYAFLLKGLNRQGEILIALKVRQQLSVKESLLLLGVVIAPLHGGISTLLLIVATLSALQVRFCGGLGEASAAQKIVAGVFLGYFVYFYASGALIAGDFWAPFPAMKGNLPLLVIAVYGWVFCYKNCHLTTFQLGYWATIFVYITVVLSAFSGLVLIYVPHLLIEEIDQIWEGGRLEMFSRNPLMFGSMLTVLSFMSLLGFFEKTSAEKWASIAAILLGLLVVGLGAQARGPILLAIPLSLISLWYLRFSLLQATKMLGLGTVAMMAAYLMIDPFGARIDQFLERFVSGAMTLAGEGPPEGSMLHRMVMYELGWRAVLDSPWIGYGYQNRFNVIIPFMTSDLSFFYGHLHNAFLNHQIAGGIPGLVIFIFFLSLPLMLVTQFGASTRDQRYFAALITVIMIGTSISTEVLGHYVHSNFYGALIMMLAILVSSTNIETSPSISRDSTKITEPATR